MYEEVSVTFEIRFIYHDSIPISFRRLSVKLQIRRLFS